ARPGDFCGTRALVLGEQLKPDDRDPEQEKRQHQRGKGVREVKVIGACVEAGQEARKAARGREPVDQRDADENDADNAQNPWHWLGHGAGLAEARASGKRRLISVASVSRGAEARACPAAQRATGDRKSATRAGEIDEASTLTAS